MISTVAPSASQKARSSATLSGEASLGGVRMHQRPANSPGNPASGPLSSVPATGWAGITVFPGRVASKSRITLCFEEPTSLTMQSAGTRAARSLATAFIAPTGTHSRTRSASRTASTRVSQTVSASPRSAARRRVSSEWSKPSVVTSPSRSRMASPSDPPRRPRPTIATRRMVMRLLPFGGARRR